MFTIVGGNPQLLALADSPVNVQTQKWMEWLHTFIVH